MLEHTIGIDLGGTNIKAGVVSSDGEVVLRREIETQAQQGFEHVLRRIVALIRELAQAPAARGAAGVGIGVPGPMNFEKGLILRAPNLPGWENVPLRDVLRDAVGMPVIVDNDANVAAYGEFVAGAAREYTHMVMLTLGTGIGGGIVLNGRIWRGAFDNAGEIGHTLIVPGGRPCPCGQRGCLERYASASAVGLRAAEAVSAGEASRLRDLKPEEIDAVAVQAAAAQGDALAARIWDETCFYLALACVNLQHTINPHAIVFGGGLIRAGDALFTPLRRHFQELSWRIADDHPVIMAASLGTDAGIIGAAGLAQQTNH